MKKKKDWFQIKRYPHIGLPPNYKDCGKLISYIKNPENIKNHSFYPFIHKQLTTRKYRKKIYKNGSRSRLRHEGIKVRDIYFANNVDSNIYSFYAKLLQEKYEEKLSALRIENIPTAYRSILLDENNPDGRNKCNIDFAEEIFEFIRNNSNKRLTGIAVDVTSFFDNLDHTLIKKAWKDIMGFDSRSLPSDHYNVYKNITKFSFVNEQEIFREFKDRLIVETKNGKRSKKNVDRIAYMKSKNVIAYCEASEIKELRNKNYIKSNKVDKNGNKRTKGIPQGSPISAILANMYMMNFDYILNKYISRIGGLYRRYSDDIVIIAPVKYEKNILRIIKSEIANINLEIKDSKTQIFRFVKLAERYYCFEKNHNTNNLNTNTRFDYLGFSFDGKYTFLKSSSLSSYYRKMKKSIRRGAILSRRINVENTGGELFKRRLYKRFTYLGASRRRKYERDPIKANVWIKTEYNDWGNYLSYAFMAQRILKNNKIKGQLRKHWKIFHHNL